MEVGDVPQEVMEAAMIMAYRPMVGLEVYNKVEAIIDKYPEWFPQEHIYRSIPEAVKELFEEEKRELYDTLFPVVDVGYVPGEGVMSHIRRVEEYSKTLPVKTLEESLRYLFEERPKKDREYHNKLKALHNKHYKKYKYKFK